MLTFTRRGLATAVSFLLLCVFGSAFAAQAAVPVVERTISIVDPELGTLVFNALAAGDPSAAEHGKLVLLLHGYPTGDEEYREVLPALAAAGYYAVAPSQRGYSVGARPLDDSQYTLDRLSRDAQSMATALGATDRFHLVGHDWGGAIAWQVSADAPWRLNTLTVLGTPHLNALRTTSDNPLGFREYFLYARLLEIPGSANIFLVGGPEPFALALVALGLPLDKARIYAYGLQDPVALNAAAAYYRANRLPPRQLPAIALDTAPTLYVYGLLDPFFSLNDARDTGQFVLGPYQFVTLPFTNHWLVENNTARVTQLILSRLQQ